MNYARNEDMLCTTGTTKPAYSGMKGAPVFSDEGQEFITLDEAKAFLRIDLPETTFDAQVTAGIAAARADVEYYLNRSLIKRTITVTMNIANGFAPLPYAPVIMPVTNEDTTVSNPITVADADGNTLAATAYKVSGGILILSGYDSATLTYSAGYEDITKVPANFKNAVLELLAWRWQHKGDDSSSKKIGDIPGLKMYRRVV